MQAHRGGLRHRHPPALVSRLRRHRHRPRNARGPRRRPRPPHPRQHRDDAAPLQPGQHHRCRPQQPLLTSCDSRSASPTGRSPAREARATRDLTERRITIIETAHRRMNTANPYSPIIERMRQDAADWHGRPRRGRRARRRRRRRSPLILVWTSLAATDRVSSSFCEPTIRPSWRRSSRTSKCWSIVVVTTKSSADEQRAMKSTGAPYELESGTSSGTPARAPPWCPELRRAAIRAGAGSDMVATHVLPALAVRTACLTTPAVATSSSSNCSRRRCPPARRSPRRRHRESNTWCGPASRTSARRGPPRRVPATRLDRRTSLARRA